MGARMVVKRVVLFGVVWLVSAVVTVGVLTVAAGVSEADTPPPDPPWVRADGTVDMSKMPDIWEVAGSKGETIGWTYSPKTPDLVPSQASSDHVGKVIESGPERVVIEVEPGVTRTIENGVETLVIEAVATTGVNDHPIFSTREEAERYRDALLASGSGGAPVNVND